MKKICPNCGTEFEPRTGHQKYCSTKCRGAKYWVTHHEQFLQWRAANRDKIRQYNCKYRAKNKKPVEKKICAICGSEFEKRRGNQKYCSKECAAEYHRQHQREYQAANREKIAQYQREYYHRKLAAKRVRTTYEKTCPICGKDFTTTNSNQIYCSVDCYYLNAKQRQKEQHRLQKNLAQFSRQLEKKTCPICGKDFEPNSKAQIYCSKQCRDVAFQIQYREKHYSSVHETRKCEFCGRDFIPNSSRQKYCSTKCRDEDYLNHPRPVQKKSSISEYARQARECNLDYGTYRAFIAMGKTFEQLKAAAHSN